MTSTGHDTTTTITVRCVAANGDEIATLPITGAFAAAALRAVVGDNETGAFDAERFARRTFNALAEYELQTDLRSHVICKHLRTLDRLALAAVGRGIPATITIDTPKENAMTARIPARDLRPGDQVIICGQAPQTVTTVGAGGTHTHIHVGDYTPYVVPSGDDVTVVNRPA